MRLPWCLPFILALLAIGTLQATAVATDAPLPNEHSTRYQVWGCSARRPRDDRPWSDVCGDRHAAAQRLQDILNDYTDRGLLARASDKPLRLRIVALEARSPRLPVELVTVVDKNPRPSKESVAARTDNLRFPILVRIGR